MQENNGLKILVVDDMPENLYFARYYFKKTAMPCTFSEARNGREALEHIARNGLPHIILLDCEMPVMDGYEFLTAYRALKLNNVNTQIYVVSTLNEEWVMNKFLNTGLVDGFYEKPFTKDYADTILKNLRAEQF